MASVEVEAAEKDNERVRVILGSTGLNEKELTPISDDKQIEITCQPRRDRSMSISMDKITGITGGIGIDPVMQTGSEVYGLYI